MSARSQDPASDPASDVPADIRADVPAAMWLATRVGLLVAALGVPLGLLWWWLAPRDQLVARGGQLYFTSSEDQSRVTIDLVIGLIGLLLGALVGAVAYVRTRHRPRTVLLAVVVGGVLGSVLAMYLGHWWGPGPVDPGAAAHLPAGTRVAMPLWIGAKGVLLAWPLGSALAWLIPAAAVRAAERRHRELDAASPTADAPAVTGPADR